MPPMKQQCQVCGGESFTTSHGLKVCDQCGRQEEHYIELLSQETIGEVDRSRLISTRLQEHEDGTHSPPPPQDEKRDNWTTYEVYNITLYEWTKALLKLGASSKVEKITFMLWVAYLQRIGIAFVPERKSSCRSSVKNTRDMELIHNKAESVSGKSLHSYSSRRKRKKKKAPTKLEKIRNKIERKKIRNALKKNNDSSFMNTTLASELSKSLNEFEVSRLSDTSTSYSSSIAADSKIDMSGTSEITSKTDESSFLEPLDRERNDALQGERRQRRRNRIVMNWIKRATHIYTSDSEEEQHQEEVKSREMEEEETFDDDVVDPDYKEEVDIDDDDDASSFTVSKKRSCKSKQQNTATKRKPMMTHKLKKDRQKTYKCGIRQAKDRRMQEKSKNLKLYKKAVRASNEDTLYRASKLPFTMQFSKLLGILYLAVLLAEDDILLSDIIRWCREGHIPYFSAPYLLKPDMGVSYYDLFMMRNSKKLPDAREIQDIAGRLAVFLDIQYVPLPSPQRLVRKFVKLLDLPVHVAIVADKLTESVDMRMGLTVPPVESMAMAAIILALKVYCGLDGYTEIMLSNAAAAVSDALPSHTSITPFSWQEWQKHISRLVWLCCQVDPPAAFHWQPLHDVCHFSPTVFSKFFWREGMWRTPLTSLKKKAGLQILTEELLKHQGHSLEEMIMEPPLFQPSRQPLQSTVEQLIKRDRTTETKEMQQYIKIGEELVEKSFTNHSLDWFCEADCAKEMHKCGSKMELLLFKGKKAKICCRIQTSGDNDDTQGKKEKRQNTTQEFLFPQPLMNYWKIDKQKHDTWEVLSPSLPFSFRWLVGVGSQVCEAPKIQVFSLVYLLQKKIKKGK